MWNVICTHLIASKSTKTFEGALGKLLSADEKQAIINRVAILALIRTGKSYSEIGELLWVSPVTISTIKKNFVDKSGHYKSRRAFSTKEKKRSGGKEIKSGKSFWDSFFNDVDLWDIITNPPRPVGIGFKRHRLK